jgi:flagellin
MGLVLNHNLPAIFASNMLDKSYSRLAVNTERLSSGLRINTAADDPAGFGIREIMRAELINQEQGLRNAADGISLLQTAEGAMAVIDEKLLRMRELAEQAATGTYSTLQREIINSEYQAMAAEIDRIANATEFNGVKLLDGSVSAMHHGKGLKIHFGSKDSQAEDYYFLNIGDLRATTSTGLRVGGDAKNDIWSTASLSGNQAAEGCCGAGIPSLTQAGSGWTAGQIFSYGYNWDEAKVIDQELNQGRYVAGAWQIDSGATLESLLDQVNRGTQSRVRIDIRINDTPEGLVGFDAQNNAHRICIGDEVYYYGSASMVSADIYQNCPNPESYQMVSLSGSAYSSFYVAESLARAINDNSDTFWAKLEEPGLYREGYISVYVFSREGGDRDDLVGSDRQLGAAIAGSASQMDAVLWYDDETGKEGRDGSNFGNGGQYWGALKATPTGYGTWGVRLDGRDVGAERDLWILDSGNSATSAAYDLNFYRYGGSKFGGPASVPTGDLTVTGLGRSYFLEVQNASDGDWAGASLRTQSNAQVALDALAQAIAKKDEIRATLGAYINRLENTISNMEIMHDTLQGAESRISDVDIAKEMTDFVRNQVLSQAAVSILSQANAMPEMALSLLNG